MARAAAARLGRRPRRSAAGTVKDVVTYMVTDGLEVTPMSAISSIALINRFSIGKGDVDLAEKDVTVGIDEVRSCTPDGFPPCNHC